MNIKKNFVIAFALGAIVFAFSTVVAFGQTEPARTKFSLYGLHFVSGGQTVRVAVQNACPSDPAAIIPCINPDPEIVPCVRVRVIFDVYEQSPTLSPTLRFARRVSREASLCAGEAATFEFRAANNGDWVSPAVFGDVAPPDSRPERLVSTLAVQQGGRTILNLPAVLKGFDPQPDPPR